VVAPTPVQQPGRPLIGGRARIAAWVLIGFAFTMFLALALRLHDTSEPTSFDNAFAAWLFGHTGTVAQHGLLVLSEPGLTIGVVVLIALLAAVLRRWDVVAFAVVGPGAAVVLSTEILKPIVNRLLGHVADVTTAGFVPGYAFPSGHETALASATTVLGVLLLRGPFDVRTKAIGLGVTVVWTVAGAAGLVRNGYHYVTDTIGGACVAIVVVLGTALVVDAVRPRPADRRPAGAGDQLT